MRGSPWQCCFVSTWLSLVSDSDLSCNSLFTHVHTAGTAGKGAFLLGSKSLHTVVVAMDAADRELTPITSFRSPLELVKSMEAPTLLTSLNRHSLADSTFQCSTEQLTSMLLMQSRDAIVILMRDSAGMRGRLNFWLPFAYPPSITDEARAALVQLMEMKVEISFIRVSSVSDPAGHMEASEMGCAGTIDAATQAFLRTCTGSPGARASSAGVNREQPIFAYRVSLSSAHIHVLSRCLLSRLIPSIPIKIRFPPLPVEKRAPSSREPAHISLHVDVLPSVFLPDVLTGHVGISAHQVLSVASKCSLDTLALSLLHTMPLEVQCNHTKTTTCEGVCVLLKALQASNQALLLHSRIPPSSSSSSPSGGTNYTQWWILLPLPSPASPTSSSSSSLGWGSGLSSTPTGMLYRAVTRELIRLPTRTIANTSTTLMPPAMDMKAILDGLESSRPNPLDLSAGVSCTRSLTAYKAGLPVLAFHRATRPPQPPRGRAAAPPTRVSDTTTTATTVAACPAMPKTRQGEFMHDLDYWHGRHLPRAPRTAAPPARKSREIPVSTLQVIRPPSHLDQFELDEAEMLVVGMTAPRPEPAPQVAEAAVPQPVAEPPAVTASHLSSLLTGLSFRVPTAALPDYSSRPPSPRHTHSSNSDTSMVNPGADANPTRGTSGAPAPAEDDFDFHDT